MSARPSQNPSLRLRLALGIAATLAAGSHLAPAEEQTAPASGTDGKLQWWNGQSLTGRLVEADADSLRWSSPLFDAAPDIDTARLRLITLSAPTAKTDDPFSVVLHGGSRVFGDLTAIDRDHLTLRSSRHGDLRIARDRVSEILRLKGGGVLFHGPFGVQDWRYNVTNTAPPPEGRRWFQDAGGAISSVALRQRITLPWKLDKPVEIAFRIRSSSRPEFELRLLSANHTEVVTTWADEIVLRRGAHFAPLLSLSDEDRSVTLRLFWDPNSGRGGVATLDGTLLGRWENLPDDQTKPVIPDSPDGIHQLPLSKPNRQGSDKNALPPDGISWYNRGRDLTIETLLIREWDGQWPIAGPTPVDPANPRLLTKAGLTAGDPVALAGGRLTYAGSPGGPTRQISLDEVIAVHFPALAKAPSEKLAADKTDPRKARLQFADGTSLEGGIVSITGQEVRITTDFSAAPIRSPLGGLQEIRWQHPPEKPDPLGLYDRISLASAPVMHGHWMPATGNRPHWKPIGATQAVPLTKDTIPVEIVRATPPDGKWPTSPSLLFLKDGQIVPGQLVAIDRDGGAVTLRSDMVGTQDFNGDTIDAMQFPGPGLKTVDFVDPGWQMIRGQVDLAEPGEPLKSVSLPTGSSFGHPSMLAGDEIQFALLSSGYGTARVRLFTDGTYRDSPSTRVLLAHYGNEVYAGIEEKEGNFDNYRQIPVEHGKPVQIRINWSNRQIIISINGTVGLTVNHDPKKTPRSGRGLIFEPANLWGNGERTVTISGFKLRATPGYTWVPPVPAKARDQALFLPRFRKNDPPGHLLVAHTGDLLRGTVESATAERIAFRTGLESHTLPSDRAAAIVWLTPPTTTEAKDKEAPIQDALPDAFGLPALPTHWLMLRSGARFGLTVESFGTDAIIGHSPTLGQCRIPIDHVHLIRTSEPARDPSGGSLNGWTLVAAPEPSPEGAAAGSPAAELVGKVAPRVELPLLGGGTFDLAKERDQVVILDFWATWCGPCVRALPEMIDAFAALDSKRVKFIAVNQAESPETVTAFLKSRDWGSLAVGLDHDQSAGKAYGVEGIPHTVIVGPDGKVAHVSTGFRPGGAAETAELVKKLLAGEAVK